MKIFIGAGSAALLLAGVLLCPDHLRQQARDVAEISPEAQANISRQLDLFVSVMKGETPILNDDI